MFDSLTVAKPFITFANDTKFLMAIHTPENHSLQHDLYNLTTSNNSWHIATPYHLQCFHLHNHFSNIWYPTNSYAINGNTVTTKDHIKDLGIMFSTDLHLALKEFNVGLQNLF